MRELPKVYEPQLYEDKIYQKWEESGLFNPDVCVEKGVTAAGAMPFSIVLPPPNVTGTLHMGHAAMLAIEDVMVRYHRMKGDRTLWVPGTDHAAIATQSKVEKLILEKEGKTKYDLGREEFLKRVEQFAQESHDTIVDQCKKMGASLDWSREAYTLDEKRNLAVRTVFKKMYDDGLIYRGHRIVNWDPKGQTVISDDELVYEEKKTKFYTFKYGPFEIGTARPETKFGDKYVVMHPDDKRYKKWKHMEKITVEWINGPIEATIIKDPMIDVEFGTGVMTITPWHSHEDFALAEKYKLDKEQIIDKSGKLLPIAQEFAGMEIGEAREKIVEKLNTKGLLVSVDENYINRIAAAERTGGIIEPQIMEQWFVDVNKKVKERGNKSLKELMQEVVRDKKIEIVPDRFEKTYFNWIDNLRDWCISRQIWYGHRVPVWYKKLKESIRITYFVHGATADNEAHRSSGHFDIELSELGQKQALDLQKAVKEKEFDILFCSDLKRAQQTAEIAFKDKVQIIADNRLRECDYGDFERAKDTSFSKLDYIHTPHPNGESYKDVERRMQSLLIEIVEKYPGKKVGFLAHQAPQLALEVLLNHKTWEQAFADDWRNTMSYQHGWDFELKELISTEEKLAAEGWEQDPDTLDTWFSSGLWTFSTLGWPDEDARDFKNYHPTSVLETGYDIIFFWVARMILMTTYTLGEVPFKTVYLHGLVRDEQGRKMSKSLDNIINPLDMIAKYGTDATRLSLLLGNTPGNDMKLSEEKIAGFRNFTNKLWNISRFMLLNISEPKMNIEITEAKTLADKWILSSLEDYIEQAERDVKNFNISMIGENLRDFTWSHLADWYLEIAKIEGNKSEILNYILNTILKLWHPYMPFVTEVIWQEIYGKDAILMIEPWPKSDFISVNIKLESSKFYHLQNLITGIRSLRAENKIEPAKKIGVILNAGDKEKIFKENEGIIKSLARLEKLEFVESGAEIALDLVGAVDLEKERPRLEKEIAEIKKYVSGLETKLSNKEFVNNAPKVVVQKEQSKLDEAKSKVEKLEEQLKFLLQ